MKHLLSKLIRQNMRNRVKKWYDRRYFVVTDRHTGQSEIFTTIAEAIVRAGISRSTAWRAVKFGKCIDRQGVVFSVAYGVHKNCERVKQGKRVNFNKE